MKTYLSLFCIVALVIFAAPGFAQVEGVEDDMSTDSIFDDETAGDSSPIDLDFGPRSWVAVNYHIGNFTPLGDGEWSWASSTGWGYRSGGSNQATCHSVNLPTGANLTGLTKWLYDNSTGYVRTNLYYINLVASTRTNLYNVNSTNGTTKLYVTLPGGNHTVVNDRRAYGFCTHHTVTGTSLQTAGVTFWYKLQISPAPGSNTFWDVPTWHPFFREIEALARSGITTGYSDGSYRPGLAVTRQAMAAFLSRALGLHFPD